MNTMQTLNLLKFLDIDFADYFRLVSNEKVMAQITEYAIPFEEAQIHFQKLLKRNAKYAHDGS